MRIDRGLWRAASYIRTLGNFAAGAGGFAKRCQPVKTTNGFTLCDTNGAFYAIKEAAGGELDIRFLGLGYFSGTGDIGTVSDSGLFFLPTGGADFLWSDTEPGVFYTRFRYNFASPTFGSQNFGVAIMTLEQPEIRCGQPGTSCPLAQQDGAGETLRWPRPDYASAKVLTHCVVPCTDSASDYALAGQIKRLSPDYDFARFGLPGIVAVQGDHLILVAREGSGQDKFAHYFAFDLGNGEQVLNGYVGSYGNTQQLFSQNPNYATKGGRWGVDHTHQPATYGDGWTVVESSSKCQYTFTVTPALPSCSKAGNGTCGACPSITVDGVNYSGRNVCALVTVSSAWNPSWEPQPAWWEPGDPVNTLGSSDCNNNYHALQKLQAGDMVTRSTSGFETMKLIQRNSNTSWYVERGCYFDQSFGSPKNHGSTSTWRTQTNSTDPVCAQSDTFAPYGQMWDFRNDLTGADTHWTEYVNHALTNCAGRQARMRPGYFVQLIDCGQYPPRRNSLGRG